MRHHGKPEILYSDQGAQFTSIAFTGKLEREGIVVSRSWPMAMDGRGRVFDNIFVERLWRSVKHEDIYLKGYASMGELMIGLTEHFAFYNGQRSHQSLGQRTPDVVYRSAVGGGAIIVDMARGQVEFGDAVEGTPVERSGTGVPSTATARSKATATTKAKAKPGKFRPAASEVKCAA